MLSRILNTFWANYSTGFIAVILVLLSTNAYAQGPVQPEAMQFESVDVTDVVNLATGDFVYTIPIMNVPGPEGDFPIVLSYHSGIGPNQPATWVGLGWTLNPGAINRTLSGYPDDFNGDLVVTEYEAPSQSSYALNIGAGWGPVGVNMSYDHHSGKMGVNAMVSVLGAVSAAKGLQGADALGAIGDNFNADVRLSFGTNGLSANASISARGALSEGSDYFGSASLSAGTNGVGLGGGITKGTGRTDHKNGDRSYRNHLDLVSTGASLTGQGLGGNFSIAGTGFSSVTQSNGGDLDVQNMSINIPLPGNFWVSLGFSKWKWSMDEAYEEESYGVLYQTDNEGTGLEIKNERHATEETLFPSKDAYNAAAQGVSGAFAPMFDYPYELIDRVDNDEKGILDVSFGGNTYQANTNINFRFLDDTGLNFANSGSNIPTTSLNYSRIDANEFGSKKVEPVIGTGSGKILGFKITTPDGMVYEFLQPVHNYFQYSETRSINQNAETIFTNKNSLIGTYATSWLLTAIKGPDYVDRNSTGIDESDWGYWVQLNYDRLEDLQIWRAPFEIDGVLDYALGSTVDTRYYSMGIREVYHLSSIETKTHIAEFDSDTSSNGMNADVDWSTLDYAPHHQDISGNFSFEFDGDFTWFEENATTSQPLFNIIGRYIDGYGEEFDCTVGTSVSKNDISLVYNDITGHSTFTVSESLLPYIEDVATGNLLCQDYNLDYQIVSKGKATLLLSNQLDETKITHKKLDNVFLYNKSNLSDEISKVSFEFDYSLRSGSPASVAGTSHGALTLKNVSFYGQNDYLVSPPYRFEYAYGGAPGSSYNPDYNKEHFDYWGSYRYTTEDLLVQRNTPQNDKGKADLSAAWSLTGIQTPTGSTVNIEYESDDFFNINDTYFLTEGERFTIDKANSSGNVVEINGLFPDGSSNTAIIVEKTTYTKSVIDYYDYSVNPVEAVYKTETISQYNSLGRFDIEELNSLADEVTLDQAPSLNSGSDYSYYLMTLPETIYGGGSRVKRISTINGNEETTSLYLYKDGQVSSGVTASLPADYVVYEADNIFSDDSYDDPFDFDDVPGSILEEQYKAVFMDHRASYGRPNPGIIYSKVQVMNVDENLNPVSGITEYEFYTAKDHPYSPTFSEGPSLDSNGYFYIKDVSGIYGKPKATTYYEQYEDNSVVQFRPLKTTENLYSFSDELFDFSKIYFSDESEHSDVTQPLGITQEKFKSYVAKPDEGNSNDFSRIVERTYLNVFGNGQITTEYFYDDEDLNTELDEHASEVTRQGRTIGYDVYTGTPIVSVQQGATNNDAVITRTTPAWWKYPGMKAKNMLTQVFQETAYREEFDFEDSNIDANLKAYDFDNNDIISSTITTWDDTWYSNEGVTGVWRTNDTYSYVADINYQGFPSDQLDYTGNDYPEIEWFSPWKMTSNITQYDVYGHATETVNEDGTFQSVIYDDANESLVLAVASNSKLIEVIYDGFEGAGSTYNAYTGERCLDIYGTEVPYSTPSNVPIHGGNYRVGAWIFSEDQTGVDFEDFSHPGNQEWIFVEKILAPGTDIEFFGIGCVDDVTVVPEYGSISYFAYDPLTWKVTAMTGPDHRTSFYEYDDAGRLIGVRDQDKNLIQSNEYQYGQELFINTGFGQFNQYDPVQFELQSADGGPPPSATYTWSFGDGVSYETTDLTSTHFFSSTGNQDISVKYLDQNNLTRRTSTTITVNSTQQHTASVSIISVVNYGGNSGDNYVVDLFAEVNGGTEPYTYQWYEQDYADDPNDELDWNIVSGETSTTAQVTKLVTDTSLSTPFRVRFLVTDLYGNTAEKVVSINKVNTVD